jgi:hypothetical protein
MLHEEPRGTGLTQAQKRRLDEIEDHFRAADPVLEYAPRTARLPQISVDPTEAGVIALIAAPLIVFATIFLGLGAGFVCAVVAIILAHFRVRYGRRSLCYRTATGRRRLRRSRPVED